MTSIKQRIGILLEGRVCALRGGTPIERAWATSGVESHETGVEGEPMSGTILVCPACQNRLRATGRLPEGERIRCPSCGDELVVDIRRASSGTGSPRARNLPLLIGLTAVVMISAWAVVGFDVMPRGS